MTNKTIEDVADENSCRYPLGEVNEPPKYFCGRKQWTKPRKHGKYYCMYHVYKATKSKETT